MRFVFAICSIVVLVACVATRAESPIFGTLQSEPERAKRNHEAGVRLAVLSLAWDRYEPRDGNFDPAYAEAMKQRLAAFRAAGQAVMLDLGMQYPPAWVLELPNARVVDQFGQPYIGDRPGAGGANGVFNQNVRDRQAAYVARALADLGTDFHSIRIGWGYYGELQFPPHVFNDKKNCYWAFDDIAQGRAQGHPPTLAACPVPAWKPGDASPDHAKARQFIDWYLDAMRDYQQWQIATVRKHFRGTLCVLYPSWGIRPGQIDAAVADDLSGRTSPEINGELPRGVDFVRQVGAIDDDKVVVYTTWLDSDPKFGDDDSKNPEAWSPAHYLSHLAASHPRKLATMAENTGPGTKAALKLSMQRLKQFNISGLVWAFEGDLYDTSPDHATISDLEAALKAR
jgi:hypothetical protein